MNFAAGDDADEFNVAGESTFFENDYCSVLWEEVVQCTSIIARLNEYMSGPRSSLAVVGLQEEFCSLLKSRPNGFAATLRVFEQEDQTCSGYVLDTDEVLKKVEEELDIADVNGETLAFWLEHFPQFGKHSLRRGKFYYRRFLGMVTDHVFLGHFARFWTRLRRCPTFVTLTRGNGKHTWGITSCDDLWNWTDSHGSMSWLRRVLVCKAKQFRDPDNANIYVACKNLRVNTVKFFLALGHAANARNPESLHNWTPHQYALAAVVDNPEDPGRHEAKKEILNILSTWGSNIR